MRTPPFPARRTTPPLRVLLLLGNWVVGGAERVAVHLMNSLPAHWDVRLGLLHAGTAWMDELDPDRVIVAPQAASRFRYDRPNADLFRAGTLVSGAIHGPRALRAMIREVGPDVVVSFLKGTAILTWLALAGLRERPRWIAREGNNVFATALEETPNPLVRRASLGLTAMAYRRADAVLTNARAMARDLVPAFGLDPAKVQTIHNPVDIDGVRQLAQAADQPRPSRPYLLAAGRLQYQKGHEILLAAFAASRARFTHDLVILGEGSRAAQLHALCASLGLADRVRFAGVERNPHAWTAGADLFVMPSRWEGFPNAAAEAMAVGTPLLLADCDYGPRELTGGGRFGTLVPVDDALALAAAMDTLLENPGLRHARATAALDWVRQFSVDTIVGRYAELIASVAEPCPARAPSLTLAPA